VDAAVGRGLAITFTTQQINSKRLPGRPLIC
jgi:hypothetical protein